jgi:hypothetical protein
MKPFAWYLRSHLPLMSLALAASLLSCPCLRAQASDWMPDFSRPARLPRDWTLPRAGSSDTPVIERSDRFLLYRMPTGYVKDPVGLDLDVDAPPGTLPVPADAEADAFNWLQVSVGSDNPYFDFRRPGDPGGLGYYRMNSQLQLFDTGKTGLNLALGASTPAGLESDGIATGPTFFSPAVACYQELGEGTTIQAFVGRHLRANSRWADGLNRSIQFGIAAQHPLPDPPYFSSSDSHHCLFAFIEALGRYQTYWNDSTAVNQACPLELLPGLHLRMKENWWISGGMIIPLSSPRPEGRLWQITCSWRF